MKSPARAALLLVLTAAACGGQDVDPGTSQTTGSGGSTSSASGGSGGGTGGTAQGEVDITAVYGADSVTVNLAALPTQDYKGVAAVPLTAVWAASKLHPDVSTLEFDFYGDDGFHPAQKGGACLVNPTGANLAQGYMLPDTRSLVWDDALGWPGCFSVKAVEKMVALDAP
jgi:hypothetical protein